jgi:hypothetical protein
MHAHEFPVRVETPETTFLNYRVLVEPASPGPWRATMFTKDAHERRRIDRVSRVVALGNRQWLVIGDTEAWRYSRVGGCGCSSTTSGTDPAVVDWLNEVVATESWEGVETR